MNVFLVKIDLRHFYWFEIITFDSLKELTAKN